ncbi:MAG: flagellar biosynthesis anti-sigma factor FlgM [Chloroflexota bacterium]
MKVQETTTRSASDLALQAAKTAKPEAQPAQAAPAKSQGASGTGPAATVQLSSRSRELHSAMAAAQAAPDVRADKVADVKRRLDNGTYVVDPTRIARGILNTSA